MRRLTARLTCNVGVSHAFPADWEAKECPIYATAVSRKRKTRLARTLALHFLLFFVSTGGRRASAAVLDAALPHTQQAENIGCITSSTSVTVNKESREPGDPGENVESYCFRMITLKNNRSINERSAGPTSRGRNT